MHRFAPAIDVAIQHLLNRMGQFSQSLQDHSANHMPHRLPNCLADIRCRGLLVALSH